MAAILCQVRLFTVRELQSIFVFLQRVVPAIKAKSVVLVQISSLVAAARNVSGFQAMEVLVQNHLTESHLQHLRTLAVAMELSVWASGHLRQQVLPQRPMFL